MLRALFQRGLQSVRGDALFRRMLRNAGWLFSANGINAVLGLARGVLVARALGVELYGILGLVITFVTMINRLTSFRMNEFVVKYVTDAVARKQSNLAAATLKAAMLIEGGSSILAFALVYLLAPLGARWFVKSPGATKLIYIYAVVVLGNLVSESATGVLQVFNQFHLQATLSTIRKLVTLGSMVVTVYVLQEELWGVLLAYLMGQLARSLALLLCAIREIRQQLGTDWWQTPLSVLAGRRRSMAVFAVSTNVSAILSLITKDSDVLWIGYFRDPTEVGYYKLAVSLMNLAMMPIAPLGQAIYPEIAQEVALRHWARLRSLLRRSTLLSGLWVLPMSLGLLLLGPWLVAAFYGKEFTPAIPALALLIVGVAFAQVLFWSKPTLLGLGLPEFHGMVAFLVTVLKVVLAPPLIMLFGYLGNAALMSGLYILGVSISVRKVSSELDKRQREVALLTMEGQ